MHDVGLKLGFFGLDFGEADGTVRPLRKEIYPIRVGRGEVVSCRRLGAVATALPCGKVGVSSIIHIAQLLQLIVRQSC